METKTNEINGINYDHSKYDSLYNEAGVIALKNAKAIANRMAKEMGVEIGQVLNISNEKTTETSGIGYGAGYGSGFRGIDALLKRKSESKVVQVEPGIIKIPNTTCPKPCFFIFNPSAKKSKSPKAIPKNEVTNAKKAK